MQKNKQIKALFFLVVFSLLLLHQLFPHLHHQHDDVKSTPIAQTEDQHHNHQHHIPEEEDNSSNDFIDFFLGMHIHISVIDEIPIIRSVIKHQKTDENIALKTALFNYFTFEKTDEEVEIPKIYNPPNNYFNRNINNPDSRGPPILA